MTFASKSSVGPSYVANGQEDHKTYTHSNDFSGTERKKEKEEIEEKEEKEHGETIKGPHPGGA